MKKQLQQLKDFHTKTNSFWQDKPTIDVPESVKDSRIRIMREELDELVKAIWTEEPIENVAKELSDVMYTVLGTVGAFGLGDRFEEIFEVVHQSNMSKIPPDGIVKYNEHGKVVKPAGYKPPDIHSLL